MNAPTRMLHRLLAGRSYPLTRASALVSLLRAADTAKRLQASPPVITRMQQDRRQLIAFQDTYRQLNERSYGVGSASSEEVEFAARMLQRPVNQAASPKPLRQRAIGWLTLRPLRRWLWGQYLSRTYR